MTAMVSALLARQSQSSLIGPAARPVLDRSRGVRTSVAAREKNVASNSEPPPSSPPPPFLRGGGYVSSVHTSGAAPPESAGADGLWRGIAPFVPRHFDPIPEDGLTELTHKQYEKRRGRRALDEQLERIRVKMRGGE